LRPSSTKRVAESLVVGKIAEQEKVTVDHAEIHAEIEEMVRLLPAIKKNSGKLGNTA
jgi:FKBP-type peptidyl-prolyl cis-trans isomerase (trigger factor)